uniref:RNA-directed DNA polymerase, eukaryota, reverse transcriptase zinc-binding domain protein n=1 Tax=Tanacetum cinerariifolium TaxID=118510 RepID=A0A699HXA3_TANCI|nr:RNA-directed DNA polymerase, eukaryota, reverse transcriptase zinc-binding domain protein [Tanacetum cinerariifolium]
MHTQVISKADHKVLFYSFVYAHNRYTHRHNLWQDLGAHKAFLHGKPWCLFSDFNSSLNLEDHTFRTLLIDISMREFKECVEVIEVSDMNKYGLHFTWNQKPKGDYGVLKKLDRIMANLDFHDVFVRSNALFQPYRIFDHSGYSKTAVDGYDMFQVVKILKLLKNLLGNCFKIREIYMRGLRFELDEAQKTLDCDPSNVMLREEEASYLQAFNEALLDEERRLKRLIFSMGDDKSPGPNGYTASFFKGAWEIVGVDISNAVWELFVTSRRILDNILLTQELMPNYCLDRGKSGLFQGDLLSPYLFTLVMEILTLILKRKSVSGLVSRLPKCTTYFCNVLNYTKLDILKVIPFEEGTLPVKYLGVPLVSTRFVYRYYRLGMEKSFSVGVVWEDIRPQGYVRAWTYVVWSFSFKMEKKVWQKKAKIKKKLYYHALSLVCGDFHEPITDHIGGTDYRSNEASKKCTGF